MITKNRPQSRLRLALAALAPLALLLSACSAGSGEPTASPNEPDNTASVSPQPSGTASENPAPGASASDTPASQDPGTPGPTTTTQPGPTATSAPAPGDPANIDLKISVVAKPGAKSVDTVLKCSGSTAKPDSTVPIADEACALIATSPQLLTPAAPGKDTQCTQQYGGPGTATIKGTSLGKTVDLSLNRTNGCAIKQWEALGPLLGEAGANV